MYARLWIQGILNFRQISAACNYTGPGNFAQDRTNETQFWAILAGPLVDARWGTDRRIEEFMRHYQVAAKMGDLLDLQMEEIRSILKLDSVCEGLEVCLERRTWFGQEGQVTLSLFYAGERMYSVTFLLSFKEGRRVAYVGAIQGVKQAEDSDAYKVITKAAHGLRPRDLTIALFQSLCDAMQVSQILAVQDKNRQHRHGLWLRELTIATFRLLLNGHHRRIYSRSGDNPEVFADYDSIWTENGGVMRPDGMYLLAPGIRQKDLTDVASKKRSMYRKRQAMLEECQAAFHALVQNSVDAKSRSGSGAATQVRQPNAQRTLANDGLINSWLNKVRPAFFGSWLWSFPAIFM